MTVDGASGENGVLVLKAVAIGQNVHAKRMVSYKKVEILKCLENIKTFKNSFGFEKWKMLDFVNRNDIFAEVDGEKKFADGFNAENVLLDLRIKQYHDKYTKIYL